jgi:hypothetical protein
MSRLHKPFLVLSVVVYFSLLLTSPTLAGMVPSFPSQDLKASEMRAEEILMVSYLY